MIIYVYIEDLEEYPFNCYELEELNDPTGETIADQSNYDISYMIIRS